MSYPTVSVIIPTYNRAHLVSRAIQSVLTQTFTDFELIIVDDASSDETPTVITKFKDPRIRYTALHKNSGLSIARNSGITVAQG
ncbi:MAG TPA: glycosyltransferase family 2 protein, partial [Allocoleopsis sp.]